MRTKLPNLELIEYKAFNFILDLIGHKSIKTMGDERITRKWLDFDIIMFPQEWGSTCGGLDVMPDGGTAFGGMEMIKEYTTVVHEMKMDMYLVFFGNHMGYMVTEAPPKFFEDLNAHNMAPMSEAMDRYK